METKTLNEFLQDCNSRTLPKSEMYNYLKQYTNDFDITTFDFLRNDLNKFTDNIKFTLIIETESDGTVDSDTTVYNYIEKKQTYLSTVLTPRQKIEFVLNDLNKKGINYYEFDVMYLGLLKFSDMVEAEYKKQKTKLSDSELHERENSMIELLKSSYKAAKENAEYSINEIKNNPYNDNKLNYLKQKWENYLDDESPDKPFLKFLIKDYRTEGNKGYSEKFFSVTANMIIKSNLVQWTENPPTKGGNKWVKTENEGMSLLNDFIASFQCFEVLDLLKEMGVEMKINNFDSDNTQLEQERGKVIINNGHPAEPTKLIKSLTENQQNYLYNKLTENNLFIPAETDFNSFCFVFGNSIKPDDFKPLYWLQNKQLLRELITKLKHPDTFITTNKFTLPNYFIDRKEKTILYLPPNRPRLDNLSDEIEKIMKNMRQNK